MTTIFYILIIIITFLLMEGLAWFTHKYVMHGFLWSWHRSHHKIHPHALERNDLFAVVFSIPSIVTISVGIDYPNLQWLLFVGIGILSYGICYVIFHDIIVHRRINIPIKAKNKYLKRIINAHYIHHHYHTKDGTESFGFLYANKKYRTDNTYFNVETNRDTNSKRKVNQKNRSLSTSKYDSLT